MEKLSNELARRFYDMCESVKNAQNSEALIFSVGEACGFASGLLLSNVIDIDCYTTMHDYINIARDQCQLRG